MLFTRRDRTANYHLSLRTTKAIHSEPNENCKARRKHGQQKHWQQTVQNKRKQYIDSGASMCFTIQTTHVQLAFGKLIAFWCTLMKYERAQMNVVPVNFRFLLCQGDVANLVELSVCLTAH